MTQEEIDKQIEAIREVTKKATQSKETARQFLIDAGIIQPTMTQEAIEKSFKDYIAHELEKYPFITPSALVLKSYYVLDYSDADREDRRFTRLRAIAEQHKSILLQNNLL
jgi:hypothetical protein